MNSILNNTTSLQEILNTLGGKTINGISLPNLTNEASASDLLEGKQLINQNGTKIIGIMPNNGAISSTMDGISVKSISLPKGYITGGTVSLDNTIDNEIEAQTALLLQITNKLDKFDVYEYYTITYNLEEGIVADNLVTSIRAGGSFQISFTNPTNEPMTFSSSPTTGDSFVGEYYTIQSGEVITIKNLKEDWHIDISYGEAEEW